MSDGELWGQSGEPRPDDEQLESRVDELFTTAVERQVAEQRNLNRLLTEVEQSMGALRGRIDELQKQVARDVAPTADRLGALDATLRSIRETQSQQHVSLRAELQEAVESFRGEAAERSRQLTAELEDVRQVDAAMGDRVADVTSTVATALERLDARQDNVAGELARLATQVGRIEESSAAARDAVGPVSARMEAVVPEIEAAVGRALSQRLDAVVEHLRARAVEDRDATRAELAGFREELLRTVRDVAGQEAEGQRTLLDETLQRRLEEVHERTAAQGARTAAELQHVAEEVGSQLHQLRSGMEERLQATEAGSRRAAEEQATARAAADERLAGQLDELHQRSAERDTRTASELADVGERVTERVGAATEELRASLHEGLRAATAGLRDDLGSTGEALAGQLAAATAELQDATASQSRILDERTRELRDDLSSRLPELQRAAEAVGRQLEELRGGVDDRFEALEAGARRAAEEQASARAAADERTAAHLAEVGDRLTGQVGAATEELRTSLHDELRAATAGLRDDLATSGEMLTGQLSAAAAELHAATEVQSSLLDERTRVLRDELSRQLAELRQASQEAGAALDERVTGLAETHREATAALGSDVRAQLDSVRDGLDSRVSAVLGELTEQGRTLAGQVDTTLERLAGELEGRVSQLREGTDELGQELRGAVAGLQDELRGAVAGLQDEVRAHRAGLAEQASTIEDGLASARTQLRTEVAGIEAALTSAEEARTAALEERLAGWRDALEARLAAGAEQQRVAGEEALDALRDGLGQVRAELTGQRETVTTELTTQRAAIADDLATQRETLTERLEGFDRRLGEQLEGQRAEVMRLQMDQRTRLREDLDGHRETIDTSLAGHRDELTTRLDGSRSELRAELVRHEELVGGIAAGLRSLASSLTAELSEVQELGTVLARNRQLDEESRAAFRASLVAELDAAVGARAEELSAAVAAAREAITGAADDQRRERAEATTQAEQRVEALSSELRRVIEASVGEQAERLAALADELRTDVERSLVDGTDRIRQSASHGDARLRDVVEAVTGVVAEVSGTTAAIASAVDDVQVRLRAEQEERLDRLTREQSELLGSLAGEQSERLKALGTRIERAAASVADRGDALEGRLATALDELTARTRVEAETANERLATAVGRVDELADHLDRMERSLVGYLEARDERLGRERELLLHDLVEQLADGLSKRERKRLAAKLEVPAPGTAPVAGTAPATAPDDVLPPATEVPPATAVAATPGAAAPDVADVATGAPADTPSARRAARKVAVRSSPSGKSTPAARRRQERGPREVLAEVKGVGPAKQSALIDTFGTLEAMRAASVEDLAEVTGIGTTLAGSIKAALED